MNQVKWMYNGVKVNGKLYLGHYSKGNYTPESGIENETITFYRRGYGSTPAIEGLAIKNDSDSQTDYFETDCIRISPKSAHYGDVYSAWKKQQEKRNVMMQARALKYNFPFVPVAVA